MVDLIEHLRDPLDLVHEHDRLLVSPGEMVHFLPKSRGVRPVPDVGVVLEKIDLEHLASPQVGLDQGGLASLPRPEQEERVIGNR
jgi:hypothetical protein